MVRIFGVALNDRSEYVVREAARALAKINSDTALEILSDMFFSNPIERPHHIACAIAEFGQRGFEVLLKGTKSKSPNIRYYPARFLGSTGFEAAKSVLEKMEKKITKKQLSAVWFPQRRENRLKLTINFWKEIPVKTGREDSIF